MSPTSYIQSRQCKYCNEGFHWSDTSHEDNCPEHPANQCQFCGAGFRGSYKDPAREKLKKHVQGQCPVRKNLVNSNINAIWHTPRHAPVGRCAAPMKVRWQDEQEESGNKTSANACAFCRLDFGTTVHANVKCALHEENCRANPQNQCQMCGTTTGSVSLGGTSELRNVRWQRICSIAR